jgi:hypothetical protein
MLLQWACSITCGLYFVSYNVPSGVDGVIPAVDVMSMDTLIDQKPGYKVLCYYKK